MSSTMKEKVLELFQCKYEPADKKIADLLNIDRIEVRQANASKNQRAMK